jgi:hypothetical protein
MGASISSTVTVDGFPVGPVLRRWGRLARSWAGALLWPLTSALSLVVPSRTILVAQALAAPELSAAERLQVLSAVEGDRSALFTQVCMYTGHDIAYDKSYDRTPRVIIRTLSFGRLCEHTVPCPCARFLIYFFNANLSRSGE